MRSSTWSGCALPHAHADVLEQIGNEVPDVDISLLGRAFEVTQSLLQQGTISSGHDISDGGIVTALLEMAFSGNCGLQASTRHLASCCVEQDACGSFRLYLAWLFMHLAQM